MPAYRLRCAHPGDAAQIARIYAPIVAGTVISFEEVAPGEKEMAERLVSVTQMWPWLVADCGGQVAGYAHVAQHRSRAAYRWSVDVTAYIQEERRGKGIGQALYQALFRVLRLQGFHQAYAGVTLPNDASVALHRSIGFELVGVYRAVGFKMGAWRDVSWWQCAIGSPAHPVAEPIPITDLDRDLLDLALRGGTPR